MSLNSQDHEAFGRISFVCCDCHFVAPDSCLCCDFFHFKYGKQHYTLLGDMESETVKLSGRDLVLVVSGYVDRVGVTPEGAPAGGG